jgi:hypothetical protein
LILASRSYLAVPTPPEQRQGARIRNVVMRRQTRAGCPAASTGRRSWRSGARLPGRCQAGLRQAHEPFEYLTALPWWLSRGHAAPPAMPGGRAGGSGRPDLRRTD